MCHNFVLTHTPPLAHCLGSLAGIIFLNITLFLISKCFANNLDIILDINSKSSIYVFFETFKYNLTAYLDLIGSYINSQFLFYMSPFFYKQPWS